MGTTACVSKYSKVSSSSTTANLIDSHLDGNETFFPPKGEATHVRISANSKVMRAH